MAAGGRHPTEGLRTRLARGRPNWWVILAVSLALIALLVETSGTRGPRGGTLHAQTAADTAGRDHATAVQRGSAARRNAAVSSSSTSTTTTTTRPGPASIPGTTSAVVDARTAGTTVTTPVVAPTTTTTTAPPATTTTTQAVLPSDRQEADGYLAPPGQTSQSFVFSGSGSIVVEWTADVYLSMTVSCPNGSQTEGGTGGIEVGINSTGSCQAVVTEPSSESTALTFSITGPSDG